ncbi:membrane dipeptidase [Arthrobacter sp. R4]|uniref:membrane dipeptidase n=1 Tax=Arthrobacter sp. R4 TaxID=644417 RepID=UPI003EDB25BB
MVRGFADIHNHQFANLAFGGKMFFGRAFGDSEAVLPHCASVHGPGGVGDVLGNVFRTVTLRRDPLSALGHLVGGYPEFDGWPRWDSLTHQSVFEPWLHRAVQGGLRLMVMLAVNNEFLTSKVTKAKGRTDGDMEAVDLQLQEARAMQDYVDSKHGGAGRGWYRVVSTPEEARATMSEGKLAVVLGIEVDYLFGCRKESDLSLAQLRAKMDQYYELGVRHIFPIHFNNNGFGGASYDKVVQSTQFQRAVSIPFAPYPLTVEPARHLGYQYGGGWRNVQGLTSLGKDLIREAIARGMMVEIDHMSARSKEDTFAICENYNYPLVSGHTGFVEISKGDKRHEGNLLPAEIERLRKLGGMLSVIIHQGDDDEIETWRGGADTIEHTSEGTSNTLLQAYRYAVSKMPGMPVAFGTDFNGLAGSIKPRWGREAGRIRPGARPPGPESILAYPFENPLTGAKMDKSKVGKKEFDFNTDGLAHVGMLPDLIADFKKMGLSDQEIEPLMNSAEGYVNVWEKAHKPRPIKPQFCRVGRFADSRDSILEWDPENQNYWLGTFAGNDLKYNLVGNTKGFGGSESVSRFWTGNFTGLERTQTLLWYPGGSHYWLGRYDELTEPKFRYSDAGDTKRFGGAEGVSLIWTGDFTGSGKTQLLFWYPGDRNYWLGRFDEGAEPKIHYTPAGNTNGFNGAEGVSLIWTGDFTGSGKTQLLFWYPGDRNYWLGRFDEGAEPKIHYTPAGNTNGFQGGEKVSKTWCADFSGGGKSEVLFWYPGDQNYWLGQFLGEKIDYSLGPAGNTAGFGGAESSSLFWIGKFTDSPGTDLLFWHPGDHAYWRGQFTGRRINYIPAGRW